MKKILLVFTALATLTATLYAACTTDVDMGNNKIQNLAAGSTDGDAVNYAQAVKVNYIDIPEVNVSNIASHSATWNVDVRKVGNLCVTSGLMVNVSSVDVPHSWTQAFLLPVGYRPIASNSHPSQVVYDDVNQSSFHISTNGYIYVQDLKAGKYHPVNATFVCQ